MSISVPGPLLQEGSEPEHVPSAAYIAANLAWLGERIARAAARAGREPAAVTLVAVSKTMPTEVVRAAYEAGLRCFGENRVQEACQKLAELADLRGLTTWHMVGRLQTNKARLAADLFDLIQSVDSLRLAEKLNSVARRRLPVLLEVNVAGETTKAGFALEEVPAACSRVARLPNLDLQGLMTVEPLVDDPEEVRPIFRRLRGLRDALGLPQLSMGMTNDFEVAIEEGATIVRVGRAIFGERPF